MPSKLSTQEFIDHARSVHGDRYGYSKSEYSGSSKKITIVCSSHGEFEQIAGTHLKGHHCPKCSGKALLNNDEWIARSRAKHSSKYTYEKCRYTGRGCRVVITCRDHGDFEQKAENHARGDGCSACSGNRKSTTERFVAKAQSVHGARYDYSSTSYVNNHEKVEIRCPDHGAFTQTPASHLSGQGCAHCAGRGSVSTEQFVSRARQVHGDRYSYLKTNYANNSDLVCITCSEHGDFYQSPSNHVQGRTGCPRCFGKHRYSKDEWIALAAAVHGDKYDYSEVEYLNAKTRVKIGCGVHGYF